MLVRPGRHGLAAARDGVAPGGRIWWRAASGALRGLLLLSLLACVGCARGVRWELDSLPNVQVRARAEDKPVFAYFRCWYLVACTQFEEQVLLDPEVLAQTDLMICVPLNFDYDKPLADKWRLGAAPAYVILAPDGRLLARDQAPITRDDMLAGFRAAWEQLGKPDRMPTTNKAPR